jgi:hypothetical protein
MEVQILKNSNDINYKIIVDNEDIQIPFRSNHLILKLLKKNDLYLFDSDLIDNINKYNKLNSELKEILKDINESLQDLLNESNDKQ